MLTTKRVLITTICGLIFGLICMYLASSDPSQPMSTVIKWSIVLSRTMMGFTIGISALRMTWGMHGIILGIICSLPMAVPILPNTRIAVATVVMGMIYGFLTELITTKLFKAKGAGQ